MQAKKLVLTLLGVLLLSELSFAQNQHQDIVNLVAGSQLVYYTSTSILSDNRASSITYVNFCPGGTYWVNYDGSFAVHGDYGGSAYGASNGQYVGKWKIVDYQGMPYLHMVAQDGNSNYYPVYKHLILQGSWKSGNTKYAIQRNKVNCN